MLTVSKLLQRLATFLEGPSFPGPAFSCPRLQTWHGVVIKVENDWRGVGRPQVAMHSQLLRFLVKLLRYASTLYCVNCD